MNTPGSRPHTLTPAGGIRAGTLEIVDRLGEGGVAEVFRAIRRRPGKPADVVVLKKMKASAAKDPFFSERFMAEVDLVQMMRHPNVVGGHEVGTLDGQPYVIIDYVEGRDLGVVKRALKSARRSMDTATGIYIVSQLLRGLSYVHDLKSASGHALKVVHRDVTPDNVLLGYDGGVSLTDFGIALLDGLENQETGEPVAGKLGYLAPEQARKEPLDNRTDLFAAGCILYELTLGVPAFAQAPNESEAAVLERVAEARFARPSKVDPDFPRDLEHIIVTAMDRKPSKRYPNAATFLAAVEDLAFTRPNEKALLSRVMQDLFAREQQAQRITIK